jgi:hypothetical protein
VRTSEGAFVARGETPLVAGQEILTYASMPVVAVVIAAVSQEVFAASRDLGTTIVAMVLAWVYLRFVHRYGPGSVGDTRDAFEFLSLLPAPMRCVQGEQGVVCGGASHTRAASAHALSPHPSPSSSLPLQHAAAPPREAPERCLPPPAALLQRDGRWL